MTKSRESKSDLVNGQASNPYSNPDKQDNRKNQFNGPRNDHAYKTAEISLLCHKACAFLPSLLTTFKTFKITSIQTFTCSM